MKVLVHFFSQHFCNSQLMLKEKLKWMCEKCIKNGYLLLFYKGKIRSSQIIFVFAKNYCNLLGLASWHNFGIDVILPYNLCIPRHLLVLHHGCDDDDNDDIYIYLYLHLHLVIWLEIFSSIIYKYEVQRRKLGKNPLKMKIKNSLFKSKLLNDHPLPRIQAYSLNELRRFYLLCSDNLCKEKVNISIHFYK